MKRFSGDPVFRFYYGVALVLEGRTQEGIRELDPLQQYPEVNIELLRRENSNFTKVLNRQTVFVIARKFRFFASDCLYAKIQLRKRVRKVRENSKFT